MLDPDTAASVDFSRLSALRRYLLMLADIHELSLAFYFDHQYGVFRRTYLPNPPGTSLTSTATCVISLCDADLWKHPKHPEASYSKHHADIIDRLSKELDACVDRNSKDTDLFEMTYMLEAIAKSAKKKLSDYTTHKEFSAQQIGRNVRHSASAFWRIWVSDRINVSQPQGYTHPPTIT